MFALACLLCVGLFAQDNPVPTIIGSPSPQAVVPGSGSFTLTVRGAGFVSGAVVDWNGSPRSTTFISSGEVQAQIPASDVALAGSALITVTNPPPGGGLSSSSFAAVEVHQSTTKILVAAQPKFYGSGGPSILVADLNGDNKLDLVQIGRGIEILLGNGDGTFSKSQAFLGAPAASAFAFGDFNRDGNEDIVFAGGMQAHVLFGDGTGKFASSPGFGFFPFPPVGLVAADFNGDGILDLEVSPTYGGFYVLLGNADGTFQPEQNNTSLDYAIFPLAGDFNGDGILDLAVYDEGGQALNILAGNGDGTFQLPVPVPTGIVAAPFYVNDLNADGKLDIVFEPGTADRNIGVLIGNGDGTFQPPQFFATGYVAYPIFAIGDFNSDGLTDLFATKEADGSVASLELGNGDGTFQSASRVHLPGRMVEKTQRIFVGDFNSDGLLDFDLPLLDGSEVFLQQPQ